MSGPKYPPVPDFDDGGPAYPVIVDIKPFGIANFEGKVGMSLRDWFAGGFAAQMAGENQNTAIMKMATDLKMRPTDMMADVAYDLADAMLRRRQRGGAKS